MKGKPWYAVSENLNRDPQFRELRKRHGDWMGFVWLEMLSTARRNGGMIPGTVDQIAEILAPIALKTSRGWASREIKLALNFMQTLGWIDVGLDRTFILKWLKYNNSRGNKIKLWKNKPVYSSLILELVEKIELRKETWDAYLEWRQRIKKPLTEYGAERALKKLAGLKEQGHDPQVVVDYAILRGWTGLWPPKEEDDLEARDKRRKILAEKIERGEL